MHHDNLPEYLLAWVSAGRPEPVPADVQRWLDERQGTRAELDELAALWIASQSPEPPRDDLADLRRRLHEARYAPRHRLAGLRAAAAVVLLGVGVAAGLLAARALPGSDRALTVVTAPVGGSAELKLAGGIVIRLNAQTVLSYRDTDGGVEEVRLDGEAFFQVPHDPARVFAVLTTSGIIRDIGTTFNVRARDNAVSVVVEEGHVALESDGRVVQVNAGQSARAASGEAPERAKAADVVAATAWTTGRLVFLDRELGDIAQELTRRFGRTFEVPPSLHRVRITAAVAAAADAGDAARAIALAAGVRYEQTGTGWSFTAR